MTILPRPVAAGLALALGFFSLLLQIPGPAAGWAQQRGRADLVIRGGSVITMDPQRRVFTPGYVAIRGDRIVDVGPESELSRRWKGVRTLSAKDQIVLPGLINTHTHAPMVLFRGIADDLELDEWLEKYIFPAEAKTVSRDFVYWGTLLACWEMLLGGTTTYADMYYFEDAIAEATAKAGMRGVLGETIIDFPSPDHKTPQRALDFTREFIRKWRAHPLIKPAVAPHSAYTCSVETLQAAEKLSKDERAPLIIHVAEAPSETKQVMEKYGARPVPHLERIGLLNER
ncbi:MAG: amidohydrolase family protein, partial [Acidobacteria bacterium]|nr:amidohydrolase family protein [Acidobacteriota bacterium]